VVGNQSTACPLPPPPYEELGQISLMHSELLADPRTLLQSLGGGSQGGSFQGGFGGATTPGGTNAFGSVTGGGQGQIHRPRSIRRLMSEKSFNMDTVYSGMLMESDLPSEPLEVGPPPPLPPPSTEL